MSINIFALIILILVWPALSAAFFSVSGKLGWERRWTAWVPGVRFFSLGDAVEMNRDGTHCGILDIFLAASLLIRTLLGSSSPGKALSLIKNHTVVNSGDGGITIRVKNISDLPITSITAQVSVTDAEGEPVPCNSKDDSNTFTVVYHGKILPGEFSQDTKWKYVNFKAPESPAVSEYEVKITEFQIDDDWVKTIRKKNQPTLKVPVHL